MNRKIKLRIWDEVDNRFIIGWQEFAPLWSLNINDPKLFNLYRLSNRYVLQQYTGLKDKQGEEICEGDILSYCDGEERLVIQWAEEYAAFVGEIYLEFSGWDENGNDTWEEPNFSCHRFMDEISGDNGEIIGNVFENPELIVKEKP